ncbi:arylesterase [Methylovorus glucosotrophus]|nr:arylesterase [Methylovorus glucosotrophus]
MIFRLLIITFFSCCTALTAMAAAPSSNSAPVILVFGDSLSAGYGIPRESGWVSLLQQRLQQRGLPHRVVNASISGETTSGGLSRIAEAVRSHQPSLVLVELGANDGLRGLPVEQMQQNLNKIIATNEAAKARTILIGMMIPPNYGPRYTQSFNGSFRELAEAHKLPLVPFLLEGVAGNASLNQDDGLHPRAEAQERLLDNVWKVLAPALKIAP